MSWARRHLNLALCLVYLVTSLVAVLAVVLLAAEQGVIGTVAAVALLVSAVGAELAATLWHVRAKGRHVGLAALLLLGEIGFIGLLLIQNRSGWVKDAPVKDEEDTP